MHKATSGKQAGSVGVQMSRLSSKIIPLHSEPSLSVGKWEDCFHSANGRGLKRLGGWACGLVRMWISSGHVCKQWG